MKKYAYNDITLMQYIVLINGMQVGTGVLSLPRVLAEKAGTDGWIAILIGWIFSTISGVFISENSCKISRGHNLRNSYTIFWENNRENTCCYLHDVLRFLFFYCSCERYALS